jgi:methyl-accepting chemotaxis protein
MRRLVKGVADSTKEQSNNSERISDLMRKVDQVARDSLEAVREISRSTVELTGQADSLKGLAGQFQAA